MSATTDRPTRKSDADIAQGDVPPTSATPAEKGQYVYARYAAQNDHYAGFYQTWSQCVLFLLGRQWNTWNSKARRYTTDTDVPPWRQQPVTNVTYAVYRTLAAKLTKQHPTLEVVPPSGDSDDRAAAALAQALLVHLWRALGTPAKVRRAIGWFLCTGQVYLRVHWDPTAGKRVPLATLVPHPTDPKADDVECPCGPDGKPLLRADGSHDLTGEAAQVPEGEVALDLESPLSVRFNPDASDASDATEMYVARLLPRGKAAQQFDMPESELEAGGEDDRQMHDDLLASAATGPGGFGGGAATFGANLGASQDQALGARVLVIEYYRKPDPDGGRPDGAHWITVGRKQVWPKTGEAPLPNGFWPPLIPVLSLPIPGQPQAMGILPQVVPLNEQLNTLDGKIMEHEVTMSMGGKWIVHPADAGLRITSDPAQVLASKGYMDGKPPIQADLKPLPDAIYEERAVVMDKIRTVMALSEVELGKAPEGVTAGRAFLVLQEVTDSVIGPDLQAWEDAFQEIGRRELVLCQQHYREQRTIAIRGERGAWEFRAFTGADLRDATDVRVQVGSSFPWSRAAQQDVKLSILTAFPGLVTDPASGVVDRERLAKFLDVGGSGLQSFESDEDPTLVEVEREHAMFEVLDQSKGEQQIPQLAFWQSQPKHYEAHCEFMQRNFGRFMRWTPFAQQAFLEHMRLTAQAVDGIAQTMADAQNPPPGQPGEPGAAGDPNAPPDASAESAAPGDMGGGGTMNANERPTLGAADYADADTELVGA